MSAGRRSLPKGEEPWQTFTVEVRVVRGQRQIRARVMLGYVTGVVGPHHGQTRPVWEGVVGERSPEAPFSPEWAAQAARGALDEAFPPLF